MNAKRCNSDFDRRAGQAWAFFCAGVSCPCGGSGMGRAFEITNPGIGGVLCCCRFRLIRFFFQTVLAVGVLMVLDKGPCLWLCSVRGLWRLTFGGLEAWMS